MKTLKTDTKNRAFTVFVDLDSTLCDTRQRWHLVNEEDRENTDWAAYSRACANDDPIEGTIVVVRLLHAAGYRVVIVSSRHESSEADTRAWLEKHDVPYDDLLLRDEERPKEASLGGYKVERIQGYVDETAAIPVLMIDDWPPVKEALQEAGIPTLLVNPNYYESGFASTKNSESNESQTRNGSAITPTPV